MEIPSRREAPRKVMDAALGDVGKVGRSLNQVLGNADAVGVSNQLSAGRHVLHTRAAHHTSHSGEGWTPEPN